MVKMKGKGVHTSASNPVTGALSWADLPPELLREVINRVEANNAQWPSRQNVVACAGVCKTWRSFIRDAVLKGRESAPAAGLVRARFTFPFELKEPGPRTTPVECFIRRSRKSGTYTLFLGLPPTPTEAGKFLMCAKRCGWRPSCTDYAVTLDPHCMKAGASSYVGKLRANFLSTKFSIFDSSSAPVPQPPPGAPSSKLHPLPPAQSWASVAACGVAPQRAAVGLGNPGPVISVAYALNVLGTRGPRRIQCTMHDRVAASPGVEEGAVRPSPGSGTGTGVGGGSGVEADRAAGRQTDRASAQHSIAANGTQDAAQSLEAAAGAAAAEAAVAAGAVAAPSASSSGKLRAGAVADCSGSGGCECGECAGAAVAEPLVLKNKPPRWHEQLQCWCLNFRGRVTVASVKNFQLMEGGGSPNDDRPVLLQFGKVGKDTFTMDFRYPLSAFQAFAICLSSFDTKVACE